MKDVTLELTKKASIMLTAKDYQTALDVQSAINLSGVVHSFSRIMSKICEDVKGTDNRNNHAICRLFAEQIMFLTSGRNYEDAYNECEQKAKMIIIETHEYRFPSSLLPALINNEPVDEIDRDHFNAFLDELEKHKKEYGASHYMIGYSDIDYFSHTNCLSDVGCNVTDISVHFIR